MRALAALITLSSTYSAVATLPGLATWFFSGYWQPVCHQRDPVVPSKDGNFLPPTIVQIEDHANYDQGFIVALGTAAACRVGGAIFDKVCNCTVLGEVAASTDGGLTWSCASSGPDTELAVSRLWSTTFTYSALAGQDTEVPCSMVCVAGGQDARPNLPANQYGVALSSVYCSRNGTVWYPAAPLPTAVVAATGSVMGAKVIVVGGLRADGSRDALIGTVDPVRCTVASWTRVDIPPGLGNLTQLWSVSFPALPAWNGPSSSMIGGKPVLFIGGGTRPSVDYADISSFSGVSVENSLTRPQLWYTLDEGLNWTVASVGVPHGTGGDVGTQRAVRLGGRLAPGNLLLPDANTSEVRVLVLTATAYVYTSVDDGASWDLIKHQDANGQGGGAAGTVPRTASTAPYFYASSLVPSTDGTPVIHALDPWTGTLWRGYPTDCLNQCPPGDEWRLASPCNRSPFDAVCYRCSSCIEGQTYEVSPCSLDSDTVCQACTVCPTAPGWVMLRACSLTRDAECAPPIDPPTPLPQPGDTPVTGLPSGDNPVAGGLLLGCIIVMWLLFLAAGGACSMCASHARLLNIKHLRTRAQLALVNATAGSGSSGSLSKDVDTSGAAEASPAVLIGTWQMTTAHFAFVCYLTLDVSFLSRAAQVAAGHDGERLSIAAQGVVGLACLLFTSIGSYWRLKQAGDGAQRLVLTLRQPAYATAALATSSLWAGLSALASLYQGVRAALLFCVHPLASLWLTQLAGILLEEGRLYVRSRRGKQDATGIGTQAGLSATEITGPGVEAWMPQQQQLGLASGSTGGGAIVGAVLVWAATDGVHLCLAGVLLSQDREALSGFVACAALASGIFSSLACMAMLLARGHVGALQPTLHTAPPSRWSSLAKAVLAIPGSTTLYVSGLVVAALPEHTLASASRELRLGMLRQVSTAPVDSMHPAKADAYSPALSIENVVLNPLSAAAQLLPVGPGARYPDGSLPVSSGSAHIVQVHGEGGEMYVEEVEHFDSASAVYEQAHCHRLEQDHGTDHVSPTSAAAKNIPAHMQPAVYPAGLSDRGTSAAGEADSWLDRFVRSGMQHDGNDTRQ